jgi:ATP synthase protein I
MTEPKIGEPVQVAMTNAEETVKSGSELAVEPDPSMLEYYQLQRQLLLMTITATGVIFVAVCCFYPLDVALNYLVGATVGIVYLRMLGKDVEKLGRGKEKISQNRILILAGVIIVATQLHQLKILPIFLGFLTYKVALMLYVLITVFTPEPK